jgi:hypothetical protein
MLYSELGPDIQVLCSALFDLSETLLCEMEGTFLPHGAILTRDDTVTMVAAAPDGTGDIFAPAEALPRLHDGLRHLVVERSAKALAVAESVSIQFKGDEPTKAIKVLIEHERGMRPANSS